MMVSGIIRKVRGGYFFVIENLEGKRLIEITPKFGIYHEILSQMNGKSKVSVNLKIDIGEKRKRGRPRKSA